jgi:hypothetical protein
MKLQLKTTLAYSTIGGVIVFLSECAGFRGRFRVWDYPLPLTEIWWHLPVWIALVFAVIAVSRLIHRLLGGDGEL